MRGSSVSARVASFALQTPRTIVGGRVKPLLATVAWISSSNWREKPLSITACLSFSTVVGTL